MSSVSSIHHLFAFQDGDTITPAMGVKIDAGYGLQQYYNPTTDSVIATDFTQHNAILYPQAYSSKKATVIVPETSGQQWYYNNISDEGAILADGAVKTKFADIFSIGTITVNGLTLPSLTIKGNLATKDDHTDKYIYYSSTSDGKAFVCQKLIPIQSSVGDAYKVLLSVEGQDGTGDNILSNDNDYIKWTATLQLAGQPVAGNVTYLFQRLENNAWVNIVNTADIAEVGTNSLKVYNAAVEGVEQFRCVATCNSNNYVEVFEATDIHDPYYIIDGCSITGDAVNIGETATFNPSVCDRSSGTTQTGWTFSYTLYKTSDGTVISDITEKELTYDNIYKYGGINVRIEASKS